MLSITMITMVLIIVITMATVILIIRQSFVNTFFPHFCLQMIIFRRRLLPVTPGSPSTGKQTTGTFVKSSYSIHRCCYIHKKCKYTENMTPRVIIFNLTAGCSRNRVTRIRTTLHESQGQDTGLSMPII